MPAIRSGMRIAMAGGGVGALALLLELEDRALLRWETGRTSSIMGTGWLGMDTHYSLPAHKPSTDRFGVMLTRCG